MSISGRGYFLLLIFAFTFGGGRFVSAQTFFSDDFSSSNAAGWTLGANWEMGPAQPSFGHAFGFPDPAVDNSPTVDNGIAGVIIGGNSPSSVGPAFFLTSPSINTTGAPALSLSFARWLNTDNSNFMRSTVEVFDGTSWQVIFLNPSSGGITDNAWSSQMFDVTPYSNSNFGVRFGVQVMQAGVFTVSSWNVDDVKVAVPEPTTCAFTVAGCVCFLLRRVKSAPVREGAMKG